MESRSNPYKEKRQRHRINQLTAIIRTLRAALLNSAHGEYYRLIPTEETLVSQPQNLLIRSVQALLPLPVGTVLAPELGSLQFPVLGPVSSEHHHPPPWAQKPPEASSVRPQPTLFALALPGMWWVQKPSFVQ